MSLLRVVGALVSDTVGRLARLDASTHALTCIEYPHHEIHKGASFMCDVNTTDLQNNALNISFTTPDTATWLHLTFDAQAAGQANFEMREAPTGGVAGGNLLPVYNRNRNSANVTTVINTNGPAAGSATTGATAGTAGTVVHHAELGAGKNKLAGELREVAEWILEQNITYCFRMTSGAANIPANLTLNWYEHEDRD